MEALLTPSPPLLPYNAVLDWTGLLLDVHFTQLAMVPEARQLLTSLHSRVSKQVGDAPIYTIETFCSPFPGRLGMG